MFRVGRSVGTTIYRGQEPQPCAWVPGDADLAERIVSLLNGDQAKIAELEKEIARLREIEFRMQGLEK